MSSHFDIIVVGSGAAGMTAAVTAGALGATVLVIEKSAYIGGTLAWSGGAGWLPNNPHMSNVGAHDSIEMARSYIQGITGKFFDSEMIDAFLKTVPEMVQFLESKSSAVRFQVLKSVDYHPELAGSTLFGRSLIPQPYDGRELGAWLPTLRAPKLEMTVFGGMQVDPTEALHLQRSWRSIPSFRVASRLMGRYFYDRLRFGKGTRLIRGTALAARLLRSCLDRNVKFWTSSPVIRLLGDSGTVRGVLVKREDREEAVLSRRAVIVASGGFSANTTMRRRHIPFPDDHIVVIPATNTGDGIEMATAIGAAMGPDNAANAIWSPSSQFKHADGALRTYPHFAFDRCKPGAIMVDHQGLRFVNEAASYHVIGNLMHQQGIIPAWLIADRYFLRKYGMGIARPAPYPVKHFVRDGYLVEAATIGELSRKIGVPADNLTATVTSMNDYATTGVDLDFSKGGDPYSRSLGDPQHAPNPCLGEIRKPPFYALALYPGDAGTTLGLRVNSKTQVIHTSGLPIHGLFAAGLDMNSVLRGHYPGAGSMIGPALTFGFLAGKNAASMVTV